MKTLQGFNLLLWLIGAAVAVLYTHSFPLTLYELTGASLAAVMWRIQP